MAKVTHFELVTEAVRDDGARARMTGAIVLSADCALCGQHLVDEDGTISASITTIHGRIRLTCMEQRCPR